MWDERYGVEAYAYGKSPNTFLETHYSAIPKGKVLSLAEGEGRNAVFLARQGYEVTAVDASAVGLEKARKLAAKNQVSVTFIHADLTDFDPGENQWDGIVSIFCPLPAAARATLHEKVLHGLKSGGVYLLEAYTPDQLQYGTGGGQSAELMTRREDLLRELPGLNFSHLSELTREVIEGTYHTGLGAVVQAIGTKI